MKTTFKMALVAGMAFFAQVLFNPVMATEKEKDPRVQIDNNHVKIWLLNEELSNLSIKIYDQRNRVIKNLNLGDALTVGRILDFNGSDKGFYRLVVLADQEVVFDRKIQMGTDAF